MLQPPTIPAKDPGVADANRDDRLESYLSPIFADTLGNTTHIAVAVSGGADSMALALLLQDWRDTSRIPLTALTVDHGLRAGSAEEARQVAQWMQAQGMPHHILTPPALAINNVQARAREMRYGVLTAWCRDHEAALLIAHHADDQAETVALQQHRGDSPPSRAGMALVRDHAGVPLIRPLLGVRKSDLIAYLQARGQPWLEDPSNRSDAFARNRLRGNLDDATRRRLWFEAQIQGERRHHDDLLRNAWVNEQVRATGTGLRFALAPWRAMVTESGTDLLSRAIQAVGRSLHRPRLQESVRLAFLLRTEAPGKETLGGTLIRWDADSIEILLEPKRRKALESAAETSHIPRANPLKLLASEPFRWFNHAPFAFTN